MLVYVTSLLYNLSHRGDRDGDKCNFNILHSHLSTLCTVHSIETAPRTGEEDIRRSGARAALHRGPFAWEKERG